MSTQEVNYSDIVRGDKITATHTDGTVITGRMQGARAGYGLVLGDIGFKVDSFAGFYKWERHEPEWVSALVIKAGDTVFGRGDVDDSPWVMLSHQDYEQRWHSTSEVERFGDVTILINEDGTPA
jgi:hypothetical protein